MGVQNLWQLLEPCGRRVNIEALTNKRLAVDASIWLFQFIKTMRDARGEMLRNAHLLGFFRRICRLLFHRIRPVFVFDGATPPLKRRTTIARRRRREQHTAKLRKSAEKLLMAQLKKHALNMDKKARDAAVAQSLAAPPVPPQLVSSTAGTTAMSSTAAGSSTAVEAGSIAQADEAEVIKIDDEEEELQPKTSMDAMLAQQLASELERGSYAQDMLMHLKAGDAEAADKLVECAVAAVDPSLPEEVEEEEEEEEEDEEEGVLDDVLVPSGGMQLDPAVMSTLPPSMQLDLLTRMRDHKIFENREHFQKHAEQPTNFSAFQIQEYLKASQFRRQMESVKDAMNASVLAGAGGLVAKRIAAEEGREYILQKDEQQQGTQDNGTRAHAQTPEGAQEAIEISVSLPGGKSVSPMGLLFSKGSPQQQEAAAASASEEEWEDAETGQAVHRQSKEAGPDGGEGSQEARPADWRERMRQRQKYWSLSQGFRFGRKLADWGREGDDDVQEGGEAGAGGAGSQAPPGAEGEDAHLQEAIRRSLVDAAGKSRTGARDSSDDEPDLIWQAASEQDAGAIGGAGASSSAAEAGPSSLAATEAVSGSGAPEVAGEEQPEAPPGPATSTSNPEPGQRRKRGLLKIPSMPASSRRTTSVPFPSSSTEVKASGADRPHQQPSAQELAMPLETGKPQKRVRFSDSLGMTSGDSAQTANRGEHGGAASGRGGESISRMAGTQAKSQAVPDMAVGSANKRSEEGGLSDALLDSESAVSLRRALLAAEAEAVLTSSSSDEDDPAMQEVAVPEPDEVDAQIAPETAAVPLRLHQTPPTQLSAEAVQTEDAEDVKVDVGGPEDLLNPPVQPKATSMNSSAPSTLPVNMPGSSMPRSVPAYTEDTKEGPPQPAAAAARDADALARAAAEEEQLRAEMEDEEKEGVQPQEPPDSPVQYSKDPWAHDAWEDGGVWKEPQQDGTWVRTNPTSAAAASRARPARALAAVLPQEPLPPHLAFDLDEELAVLEAQTKSLQKSHRKQTGINDTPTSDMYEDCQELLQLFGLPYIIAPSEAEAQCAWLDAEGLVDGVVTDDNDVFLFGGRHVYRHIFEDRKYVEDYRMDDIQRELGLDRDGLIHMALLLGSDYTEGVAGIGVVNALEVVQAFRSDKELRLFREWVMSPDEEELRAAAASPAPRGGKRKRKGQQEDTATAPGAEDAEAQSGDQGNEDEGSALVVKFKSEHRKMRKNWDLPERFPDARVIKAYREARVDNSKERFTHGRPDEQLLRKFCHEKFGWAPDKVDQILAPVLKNYDARQAQMTMDTFLSFNQRFAKIRSKRLAKAVAGISKAPNPEVFIDLPPAASKKRKAAPKALEQAAAAASGAALADPSLQLGVFANGSGSDEELLAALEQSALGGRGRRGGRGRGRARAGGSTRARGRGRGRGRKDTTGAD